MVMSAAAIPTVRGLKFIMLSLSKLVLTCSLFFAAALWAQSLPAEIDGALTKARIPKDAISLYAIDTNPSVITPILSHRAHVQMNPASVMKLVTSVAALDLLGSAYTWQTQVLIDPAGKDGSIKDGVLNGDLVIKGGGDPKLVVERLWLLLTRIRSFGIHTINGNIVLDNSAFALPIASATSAAAFDGEPTKPYNASPDALLINFKSVVMTFTVHAAAGVAAIQYAPHLAGVTMPAFVPLIHTDCNDYRSALKADFSDPKRIRFLGSYPKSCGERVWPIAYADPAAYAGLAVRALWEGIGGRVNGTVRTGSALVQAKPLLTFSSPSLGEVLRDMNKFSNNVMAQQIFLSLSLTDNKPASFAASRHVLTNWWQSRYGALSEATAPVVDNGSGLSRDERISALSLAKMLQNAYAAPYMPELIASLPQTGMDGTLRRSKATAGAAHLKTGSLNNVVARAGYVDAANGKRYVVIAIINSESNTVLAAARPMLDALIDWTAKQ